MNYHNETVWLNRFAPQLQILLQNFYIIDIMTYYKKFIFINYNSSNLLFRDFLLILFHI